ncbi:MAG: flagellar hook protein FlgE [Alphaproteobacteria bacterium]|nr:flagellar hook protein FlgE [Alphaproteobacteria bacterium]
MSLYGAMFSGVSGLNAQSQALGMISDNISNVNTVGYKNAHASFSTLVTRQTGNTYAPGGVRSAPVYSIDRQGLLQASEDNTDLAISGQGFFVMTEAATPTASDTRFYSRAGEFAADSEGFLRAPTGFYLQGWRTDLSGTPTASNTSLLTGLESIRVNSVSGSASPTSTVDLGLNLPASATTGATESTNTTVFDSLGVSHTVALTWTKQAAANTWVVTAAATDAGSVEEGTVGSGTAYSVTVVFNGDGTPASFDGGATPPVLALGTWSSGASNSLITPNLGTQNVADGVTQFSSTYSVSFNNQDGTQFGNFFGVKVDEDGIVTALFDNGETQKIYKIPIATFPNPNGLGTKTGTAFTQSEKSGDFFLRSPGEGNAGTIVPSALESSTSDIATEFTSLIITQRAYAAKTRIITTADEMLSELIAIKR